MKSPASTSSPVPADALRERVRRLDGQDYAAYQSLRGRYRFPGFDLAIERVPKDPYAPPGTAVFRLVASRKVTGLTAQDTCGAVRAVAVGDYLARRFAAAVRAIGPGRRGTGHSGVIAIAEPGPAVLDRTSVCPARCSRARAASTPHRSTAKAWCRLRRPTGCAPH